MKLFIREIRSESIRRKQLIREERSNVLEKKRPQKPKKFLRPAKKSGLKGIALKT